MLKGVVGLVTGGASGLGKATVERIVREGGKVRIPILISVSCLYFVFTKVTMCDLPSSQGAAVASAINSPNCIFVPTDITKPADVENALAETKDKFGRLDATINCAGIGVAFKVYNFCK